MGVKLKWTLFTISLQRQKERSRIMNWIINMGLVVTAITSGYLRLSFTDHLIYFCVCQYNSGEGTLTLLVRPGHLEFCSCHGFVYLSAALVSVWDLVADCWYSCFCISLCMRRGWLSVDDLNYMHELINSLLTSLFVCLIC